MKADTFDFPLSLAAIKDWPSRHSPYPLLCANREPRSCLPTCPSWVSDLCICNRLLKAIPLLQISVLPPDSIKLLEAWEQLSHYPIWTWTLSLRRFTDHWAASLPWLLAQQFCEVSTALPTVWKGGHHILFFSQAWYVLLKWLNISTFFPLK